MKNLVLIGALAITNIVDAQEFEWAKCYESVDPTSLETIQSVVTDDAGNVYSVGYFNNEVNFDPTILGGTPATTQDIFIQKRAVDGTALWTHRIGGIEDDHANDIALDEFDNVYVTGFYQRTVDFDPDPTNVYNLTAKGTKEAFILKLENSGDFVWAKTTEGDNATSSSVEAYSISANQAGSVTIAGSYAYGVDFDPVNSGTHFKTSNSGSKDIFVLNYDLSGNVSWFYEAGGPGRDLAQGIDAGNHGDYYVTGNYDGSVSSVSFSPTHTFNRKELFIEKIDGNTGNCLWARSAVGSIEDYSQSIAVHEDNVYTTGYFSGTVVFSFGLGVSNGAKDIFVRRFNYATGFPVGGETFGGSGDDKGYSVALNSCSELHLAGSFTGTVDFDNSALTHNLVSNGRTDGYIVKLHDNFDYYWANSLGTVNDDFCRTVSTNDNGTTHAGGQYDGTLSFSSGSGLGSCTSAFEEEDAFVVKIAPYTPNLTWTSSTNITTGVNCTEEFSINVSNVPDGVTYQWQLFNFVAGAGWVNTVGGAVYSGSNTPTLTINDVPFYWKNETLAFRLVVSAPCMETVISTTATMFVDKRVTCEGDPHGLPIDNSGETANLKHATISAYPNPFNDHISLWIDSDETIPMTVNIMDLSGKLVFKAESWSTNQTVEFGEDLENGIYLVHLYYGDEVDLIKIIKE